MKRSVTHYEVPFFDVDAYRIVWHGNYAKYFEIARCALLEDAGCPYLEMEKQGYFFPVVDLQVKYVKPMLFKQKVRIEAWFAEWQHSLKIKYEIRDCETNEVYTKAQTKQFAISIPDHVTQFESPSFLVNCVDAWLADDA